MPKGLWKSAEDIIKLTGITDYSKKTLLKQFFPDDYKRIFAVDVAMEERATKATKEAKLAAEEKAVAQRKITERANAPKDPFGREATPLEYSPEGEVTRWDYSPDWGVDPKTRYAEYVRPSPEPSQFEQATTRAEQARQAALDKANADVIAANQRLKELELEIERGKASAQERYQQGQLGATQQQAVLAQQQAQWQREYQQGQLGIQTQQIEQEKQARLAQLRANPASWLEYASLSGQNAVIQPWMLPLMPQQYRGQVTTGSPIPGYTAGGSDMSGMAALTTPERQYQARMSPASLQQYYGYERARTGAPIEDVQWRLWGTSPPGGNKGLTYTR